MLWAIRFDLYQLENSNYIVVVLPQEYFHEKLVRSFKIEIRLPLSQN